MEEIKDIPTDDNETNLKRTLKPETIESSIKDDEKCFFVTLKALFVLKILKFLS